MSSRAVGALVEEAARAMRALAAADLTVLTDGEVGEHVRAVHEVQQLATAALTKAAGRLDSSQAYDADGARSAAHWMSWQCHLPDKATKAMVASARALRDMPLTDAAFTAGRLSSDHVRVLAAAARKCPDAFVRDEAHLVALAGELLFRSFQVAVRYWCDANDPDGAEADAVERYEAREAHCSRTFQGMVIVDAALEPVGGSIYARELQRLEQDLFEADWADARERLGDRASAADLRRSPQQRRADAMVEMARRSASTHGTTVPRPLLTVLVGEKSLERVCELSTGEVLTPGEVLPLLCDADVERVVFDGPSRVLDVGVRQRLFTGATRRAVEVRDRTCGHDSCDVPAEQCEIDHLTPYEAGGETVQANGQCKCPFHHRWRHRHHRPATELSAA